MGTGGEKMTFAINYLIDGSTNPGSLGLLKEFQEVNLSSILNYGEYIVKSGYKNVTILGVSSQGDKKELTLSPAISLAEYLLKNNVGVCINDPLFSEADLLRLIKGVKTVVFPNEAFLSEVVIVGSDHFEYFTLSQKVLSKLKKKTKLIIDNYGIWEKLDFGKNTKYYVVGDGSLNIF